MPTNKNVRVSDVYSDIESQVLAIGERLIKEKPKMTKHQYTYTTDLIEKELGLEVNKLVTLAQKKS